MFSEDQKIIKDAVNDSIPYQRALWAQKAASELKKARASGTEIITNINKQPFIDAMQPVYAKHAKKLSNWIKRIHAVN